MNKPTMIVGASPNPSRYSYLATLKIAEYGHTVFPMGIRNGRIGSMDILIEKAPIDNVHTVTLYLRLDKQKEWDDYILEINPKRIIFNPGAENNTLWKKAEEAGIECIDGCTLVMVSTGQF
jgi:predicted CoA-binding protein